MGISFIKKGNTLIARLDGEIEQHSKESIKNSIEREYSKTNSINLLLDYKYVSFMDSSGIGMVIGRYKEVKAAGGEVGVVNLSESIEKVFSVSGLFSLIKQYKTINDAICAVNGGVYNEWK